MSSRQPRRYQADAVEGVKTLWRQGKRSVVVVGPVGSGKTYVAELLMAPALEHEWAQVFFCAHTETLVDQPAQRFSHLGIRSAFLKAGRREDPTQALQFCSAPTLVRRDIVATVDSKGQKYKRALLVIDEAHRVKSSTYVGIVDKFKKVYEFVYILLLTATPYRLDGRGLADVADALVEISTPRQLMQQGVILSPKYYSAPLPEGDPDEVVIRPGIVGDVVATWLQRAGNLPTICRAYSIDHSKLLVERFTQANVKAAHIDGTMTTAQRRRLLVALATGRVQVLCAGSNIFDEGFDSRASYEMLLPGEEVMPNRPDPSIPESFRSIRSTNGADVTKPRRIQKQYSAAASFSPLGALQMLQDETLELGPAEARQLRDRVLDDVLAELRDFYGDMDGAGCTSMTPWLPPHYVPLAVLVDAAPTASMGAWMQRQGRVVRSWPGKTEALVLCHSGNLERHGALVWHDGEHCDNFKLQTDAKWSTKLRPSGGVAKFSCPKPRQCPGCLCVDVEGGTACVWCGAVLAALVLPEEHRGDLVERAAATAVLSTPGIKESFLRARYGEMAARVRQGLPPYKPGYAAARFKQRFGFWPQRGLETMIRQEFGLSKVGG